MQDMPRPRPPGLIKEGPRWYVRRGKGPRVRIRAEYGTDEFNELYKAAVEGTPIPRKGAPSIDSLAWLSERYRETAGWNALSAATRRQRENIFLHVIETAGGERYANITSKGIEAGKERRAKTPAQSRNFLDAMRGLFRWAKKAGHVKVDPTAGVENPPRPKGDGFPPWTEQHVETYRKRWRLGTKERIWLEVLLVTGLRRGDAVIFGKQHIRSVETPDGRTIKLGYISTEKSQGDISAVFPVWPEFEAVMKAGPCGDLTFIAGTNGRPLTKACFGNYFREACEEAGVPGSAHGLRKLAAIRAAHRGATTAQLRALFAWSNDQMPSLYTKGADRQRLAIEAAIKMGNETRKSIPSSGMPVRARGRKDK